MIFISIDDNEQANLKLMCDEIYGEENFISSFTRKTKGAGKSTDRIALNHDYILFYAKNIRNIKLHQSLYTDKDYKNKDEYFNERGFYKLSQCLDYNTLQYSNTMDYEINIEGRKFYAGAIN